MRKETLSSTYYSNYNVYNNQQKIVFDDAPFFLTRRLEWFQPDLNWCKVSDFIKLIGNLIFIL